MNHFDRPHDFSQEIAVLVMQGDALQSQKCIQNLALERKLATSLSLTWQYLCLNISISAYKIYYKHDDWLACPDKKTESSNVHQKSGLFTFSNNFT